MKKIIIKEEISPEQGYTKEEVREETWNSPPAEKGQGRYLIAGKEIEKFHFSQLRAYYLDEEALEDFDMFYAPPGWRIGRTAIDILKNLGYDVDVETLQEQEEKRQEREKKANQKRQEEEEKQKFAKEKYTSAVKNFETFLGNPKYREREQKEGVSRTLYIHVVQSANATIHNDEYTSYSLQPDGRIFSHRHYNGDWWDNITTEETVSQAVIDWFKEKTEEKQEEAKRQERQAKVKTFCPREISKDGKPLYKSFTIAEAKRIVE